MLDVISFRSDGNVAVEGISLVFDKLGYVGYAKLDESRVDDGMVVEDKLGIVLREDRV